MGQYLQINGDYNIRTKLGAKIVLDTGTEVGGDSTITYPGQVEIIGNLNVKGNTTTITSSDLEIVDRILTLNKGELGPGVTQRFAGIEIDRGFGADSSLADKAAFIFDEQEISAVGSESGSWMIAFGTESTGYSFKDSNLKLRRILTDPSTDSGNLTLIATGTGVVSVTGTENYENQVTAFGDDALTNKKYVDDAILNNPTFQIRAPGTIVQVASGTECSIIGNVLTVGGTTTGQWSVGLIVSGDDIFEGTRIVGLGSGTGGSGTYTVTPSYNQPISSRAMVGFKDGSDTRVIIADKQITPNLASTPGSLAYHFDQTTFSTFGESVASIIVDRQLTAQFYSDRILLQELIIKDNKIQTSQDTDVYVETSGTGTLRINLAIKFDNVIGTNPSPVVDSSIIYSRNISVGNTGLYFTSNNTTVGTVTDELISKSKALVFSMLF